GARRVGGGAEGRDGAVRGVAAEETNPATTRPRSAEMPEPVLRPASRAEAGASMPIASYGMLSDCNTAALVCRDGSIDWLCLPRFDSPAVFARILDPDAGHWSITPSGAFTTERRYSDGSLVLETTFTTETGVVRLRDALVVAGGQRGDDLGHDPPHALCRPVEGVAGTVELVMALAPRPEYGLVRPLFRQTEGGGRTFGGPTPIVVACGAESAVEGGTMRATFSVSEGESVGFSLRWVSAEARRAPEPTPSAAVAARLDDTTQAWPPLDAAPPPSPGPP